MKTVEERFFAKVNERDECWEWTAHRHRTGYGRFNSGERTVFSHRWAYEFFIALIPDGLDLDHLCRNRACVNPWHLDPVTRQVNLRRGERYRTHCLKGHLYDKANTTWRSRGERQCRTCERARYHAAKSRRSPRAAA